MNSQPRAPPFVPAAAVGLRTHAERMLHAKARDFPALLLVDKGEAAARAEASLHMHGCPWYRCVVGPPSRMAALPLSSAGRV
jgi:hypothetical protein